MLSIDKHITYWRKSGQEDLEVAGHLIASNKIRHGLFFLHLALEKVLKAHVCRNTNDIAPRFHNLVRLAELTAISCTQEQIDFLAEMSPFNIEGRYPEVWGPAPSQNEAKNLLIKSTEIFGWLIAQL